MARECDIPTNFPFKFTKNWFRNRNRRTFVEYIKPKFEGKPITYLELGVFEGMSMVWMCHYVLTHPESRYVGVDPWLMTRKIDGQEMGRVMHRALHNRMPFRKRAELHQANSAEFLRKITTQNYLGLKGNVDFCMVDGNHNALAVLDDLRLVHRIMKPGGWILLDDVENDKEKDDHVKQGLQMFKDEFVYRNEGRQPWDQVWKHRYCECYEVV